MKRRVLVWFDRTLTSIAGDVPDAVAQAWQTLLCERDDIEPEVVRAFDGGQGAFAPLRRIGAYPTRLHLLRKAVQGSGLSSLELAVHDINLDRARARLVEETELVADHDPSFLVFQAVEALLKKAEPIERVLDRLVQDLGAICRPQTWGHESEPDAAAEVLADLRSEQDVFGPWPGHPFRIVPEASEGEDARAVLASLPILATERVEEIQARLETRERTRAEAVASEAFGQFIRQVNAAVAAGQDLVIALDDHSSADHRLAGKPHIRLATTDAAMGGDMTAAVQAYLDVPATGDNTHLVFAHPDLDGRLPACRVDFIETNSGGINMTVDVRMRRRD